MTSVDILRAAEALKAKLVVPLHWDVWTNTLGDPNEILALYDYRKERFRYQFHPFIWQIGGISVLAGGGVIITNAMEADSRIDADKAKEIEIGRAHV